MLDISNYEVWFITGSQHLYGIETLNKVQIHSKKITSSLNDHSSIPVQVVFKTVLTTPDEIIQICRQANNSIHCIGIIAWMHTFSPAKMWINGLKILRKPLLHLHTQFGSDIPWDKIDMDFMNLHQSAHGGREFGYINTRLRKDRKVIVGHWKDKEVIKSIAVWTRVAAAWEDCQHLKIARFGDNMREVAVTEGDKVSAQVQFGYSVNGYGLGDLVERIDASTENEVKAIVESYFDEYIVSPEMHKNGPRFADLQTAARIENGLRVFLKEGGFHAFTDTFENLHGMDQLPGIAVQRLMAEGYGFGAEGDWKTAALVRTMKVMATGLKGGNSFMEDYTYHFDPGAMSVLGAHMLEICPSIASHKPLCQIHPLGIGGKSDPVRLVFNSAGGPALNASLIDLGNRFRLLVNPVDALDPEHDLPNLPVARVLWKPHPNLKIGAAAWILAGGAHHTCYSQNLDVEYLEDFAEMAGIEYTLIDADTKMHFFKQQLRWNEIYYHLASGIS